MNPYAHMFSGLTDVAVAWAFVMIWIGIGTVVLHLRDLGRIKNSGFPVVNVRDTVDVALIPEINKQGSASVRYDGNRSLCWPAARAFWSICGACAAIFAIGLVFSWLHVKGGFLFFYELFWIYSVICTFYVFPLVAIALVPCALLHGRRAGMEGRTTLVIGACMAGVALDIALYFACSRFM